MKSVITLFTLIIVFTSASRISAESADYVTQILEPTGGKIERPKDWFYSESHRGTVYTWVLSKEDSKKGPYTTGVMIQTFVGVKKGTKKTAKEFILDFSEMKKKSADKVVKTCSESNQDLFIRTCLETEEGPYRIMYSMFWGKDNMDVAVVSIAGTTKELWNSYAPVFDKMSAFELIDMKRFDK